MAIAARFSHPKREGLGFQPGTLLHLRPRRVTRFVAGESEQKDPAAAIEVASFRNRSRAVGTPRILTVRAASPRLNSMWPKSPHGTP